MNKPRTSAERAELTVDRVLTHRKPPSRHRKPLTHSERIRHAATSPVGVHSLLDLLVFSDIMFKTLPVHTETAILLVIPVWFVGRTLIAYVAGFMGGAE